MHKHIQAHVSDCATKLSLRLCCCAVLKWHLFAAGAGFCKDEFISDQCQGDWEDVLPIKDVGSQPQKKRRSMFAKFSGNTRKQPSMWCVFCTDQFFMHIMQVLLQAKMQAVLQGVFWFWLHTAPLHVVTVCVYVWHCLWSAATSKRDSGDLKLKSHKRHWLYQGHISFRILRTCCQHSTRCNFWFVARPNDKPQFLLRLSTWTTTPRPIIFLVMSQ